jgi:hypothetical protein
MTDARAARYERGWLVADEEIEAVHLAEMLDLRRQWPVLYQNATTSREQMIADMLHVGIALAMLAIGVTPTRDPVFGEPAILVARAKNVSDETMRAAFAAAVSYGIAKWLAAEGLNEYDHTDTVLAEALSGAGAQLYAGTFAPPPVDDEGAGNCWQILGYDSFDEWLAQPPWWQREGYSSLAEADIGWADEETDE